ncbi:MAG TPA: hypothetical protein VLE89_00005, partial [Chlamydiales bacterium]|nr:hypothetical protein [Chlamydiales bacterium]
MKKTLLALLACSFALLAQTNNYMGPKQKVPDSSHLVRVEVRVNDSPDPSGFQIQKVRFDGKTIPLKPRDIHGYRGAGSFQKRPGTYKLKWVVNQDHFAWPRNIAHEEVV